MVSQIALFIQHVLVALPSCLVMPSLLQDSHSQTGTHIRFETVRGTIAGSTGRAVGK